MSDLEDITQQLSEVKLKSVRKLLILDLNNILIRRKYVKDAGDAVGAEKCGNFMVWKRPHLNEFLDFAFENFDVAVWSSVVKKKC